jgi:hypothetical protein
MIIDQRCNELEIVQGNDDNNDVLGLSVPPRPTRTKPSKKGVRKQRVLMFRSPQSILLA